MDLKQIRAFVAVFEGGSINSAAASLHVAQPSLSLQIKNLEESVGVQLFERHARGVLPTAAGERFYDDCRRILGDVENATQNMREFATGVSGALDIGLIPTVTKGVLSEVLPAYMEALPNVDVRVVEAYSGSLTSWVMSGELDFALVTEPPRHDGLEMRVLSTEPLAMISGRKTGLTHLEPVQLQRMPPVKLVLPSSQHSLRAIIERYIKLGDIKVERIIEIDGLFGSLEFIRQSDFSAILPVTTIVRDLDQGDVIVNPLEDMQTTFEYFLIHQTQRPLSAAARELVTRLEEALRHTAEAWTSVLSRTSLAAE
jgi:LysR family transcriptional regulator, nitrogen assimilation regulatory protein